ncbi:AAA family ATPase [Neptunomonas antarctica]|uniref:C-terminal, D2-small domain-containing protein, of ClpB protein n=1 Tax=Neptunomonas antarctica TaxID=619304 RepID=A0A1N7IXB6_9GAMM|nr:AAA family ATPase [Neptunomonas antarctica]SIS41735.1 C-terminal, D2-small domain-containing protein, of ClpB protein [Neptunomonas antarctica]
MPFINDRIDQQQADETRQRYRNQAARSSRFKFDPAKVIAELRAAIIGQDHVLDEIDDIVHTLKADFGSPDRPLAVILLLGPTGVGKTESVRRLSKAMLGSADKLCRIDMNTLAQKHYSAALTGSPPGYVGSKEGQTLFDIDKIKGSFSEPGIVLFDEIEKADQDVVRAIMNILDTGKLALTSGVSQIDFSNTLIFMTSNLGARELYQLQNNLNPLWKRLFSRKAKSVAEIMDDALTAHFDPEFINRIDRILAYNRLETTQLLELVTLEITHLNARLRSRNASLYADDSVKHYIASHYDIRYGARDVLRRIRKELEPKIAKALLQFPDNVDFTVSYYQQQLCVVPVNAI